MKMMVSPLQISSSSYGVGAIVLSQSYSSVAAFISPPLTKMAMAAPPLVSCSFSRQVALHDVAAVDDSPTATATATNEEKEEEDDEDEDGGGGGGRITVVKVPRPRYISVSKSQLLNAIVSTIFFDSQLKADQFIRLSKCLDTIIHAEHKSILEEMRLNYDLTNDEEAEVHRTQHFQHSFVQLLYNAEFEELSAMDLLLTSSLNTDYLLTLPINVDWKKAAQSNAIIYRRGYTTEKQKGLLTVEKLDYLQSKLLQRIFLLIAKPLGKFGIWLTEVLGNTTRQKQGKLVWAEGVKLWLEKLLPLFQKSSYSYDEFTSSKQVEGVDPLIGSADLPIWLAAQRAVTRYEGILSAIGPRERLLRKLLVWIGVSPPTPQQPEFDLKPNTNSGSDDAESFSRPISLPRVSLTDIWEPASRKYCGNDLWKMFKTFISILLSNSTLQEPAFKELILLYSKDLDGADTEDTAAVSSLELKIYEKIPIPDLPVIFPHKKLSFRIIDTVRLDAATILGLLAYFINYKFENISSSPSAIVLDIIAVSALVIYVTRVVLGYKQTRDRYQLLVNRTLYEKTVASGFGSVHFLLDASEQQLYKEAILAYAIILKAGNDKVAARSAGDECEKFIFNVFNQKIEMPIDKATNTLSRLGLVTEKVVDKEVVLQAIPCSQAYEILRQKWNYLLN